MLQIKYRGDAVWLAPLGSCKSDVIQPLGSVYLPYNRSLRSSASHVRACVCSNTAVIRPSYCKRLQLERYRFFGVESLLELPHTSSCKSYLSIIVLYYSVIFISVAESVTDLMSGVILAMNDVDADVG